MSEEYTRNHCKIAVAKILQTIGWHSINSTPIEVLTDILSSYIAQIAKITKDYSNEFGQTDPNLDHLGLAFQEMEVNSAELEEYVTYVNFVPPAQPVPKYPLPKDSNLNFLKPGSKEVVTRPIHINEHLPPMYPLLEEQTEQNTEASPLKKEATDEDGSETHQFKKPADMSSPEFKRLRKDEEGGRPTREISSVMMTTSGFLSPAREGKLPEAKAPAPPPEPPKPPSPIPQVPELVPVKKKPEKRKEKVGKELFKPIPEEKIPKKINTMKDILKMKHAKAVAANINLPTNMPPGLTGIQQQLPSPHFLPHPFAGDVRLPPLISHGHKQVKTSSFNKALAAAKAKTEKLNTTITPIPIKSEPIQFQVPSHHQVDKLITEPDRKKINILKKISNVKDKHEKQRPHLNPHLMQQAHDIVSKINLSSDITIEPINPPIHHQHPVKIDSFFNSGSPPGTPPTPRTPEILAHSPPIAIKTKRKRKEKPERPRVKRVKKQPLPNFFDSDILDMSMGRPKTPDTHLIMRKPPTFQPISHNPSLPFPFPLANFGGPGLIPPLGNPLFPFSSALPDFGKNPYFQPIPPKLEPIPKVSPKPKEPKEIIKPEPAEVVPLPVPAASRVKSPLPPPPQPPQTVKLEAIPTASVSAEPPKKSKEHKKDKKEKIKKKNKKEKIKDKTEKKKWKEAKKEKDKTKKEKKKKVLVPKEEPPETVPSIPKILLKVNSPSPRPETPDTMKKLNIKPVIKKEEPTERKQRETSPGLAKISALVTGPPKPKTPSPVVAPPAEKPAVEVSPPVTAARPPGRPRIHPLKPKAPPKPKKQEQPFLKIDADGNEVWICPTCRQQDDGRPMIGCDGCDAWYHWVCVGIQVPPDENENWYCKPCLTRKNEDLQDKKKKRKKKEKNT